MDAEFLTTLCACIHLLMLFNIELLRKRNMFKEGEKLVFGEGEDKLVFGVRRNPSRASTPQMKPCEWTPLLLMMLFGWLRWLLPGCT